jgi:hypothetical protein
MYEPAMAFDAASNQLIMFGGSASRISGDTWLWKGDGWTQLHPAHSPSPRALMAGQNLVSLRDALETRTRIRS